MKILPINNQYIRGEQVIKNLVKISKDKALKLSIEDQQIMTGVAAFIKKHSSQEAKNLAKATIYR